MNHGLWTWPPGEAAQKEIITQVAASPLLVSAMTALAKAKDGLSNAQLDDSLGDNSNWMTLWVIRQLTALGFTEFKVDFFGGPAKYRLTPLGTSVLSAVTGKPAQTPVIHAGAPAPAPPKPA